MSSGCSTPSAKSCKFRAPHAGSNPAATSCWREMWYQPSLSTEIFRAASRSSSGLPRCETPGQRTRGVEEEFGLALRRAKTRKLRTGRGASKCAAQIRKQLSRGLQSHRRLRGADLRRPVLALHPAEVHVFE